MHVLSQLSYASVTYCTIRLKNCKLFFKKNKKSVTGALPAWKTAGTFCHKGPRHPVYCLLSAVRKPFDIAGVYELLDLSILHKHQRRGLHDTERVRKLRIFLGIDHLIIHIL